MADFYTETVERTRAFEGQYPRPWMTSLEDPLSANCFIVGRNQRNGYAVKEVGRQQRHVDALFNRGEQTCRELYQSLCKLSPTRRNIDRLTERLEAGGARVLETNVICFSSPMSSDLTKGQKERGSEIFRWLLERIQPKVLIVHGAAAAKDLTKVGAGNAHVIEMRSLAPPAYNEWAGESDAVLDEVAKSALGYLK